MRCAADGEGEESSDKFSESAAISENCLDPKELQTFFAYTLLMCKKIREPPLFECEASVFHLDRRNQRTWIKASQKPVTVHFYFDSLRKCYRIISVDGAKPVINSSITPSVVLAKTSSKFCQWLDARCNLVYGLGFDCEAKVNQFIEKFKEVQESSISLAASASTSSSCNSEVTPSLAVSSACPSSPATSSAGSSTSARPITSLQAKSSPGLRRQSCSVLSSPMSVSQIMTTSTTVSEASSCLPSTSTSPAGTCRKSSASDAARSHTADSNSQAAEKSSPRMLSLPTELLDLLSTLKYENERLKFALAQSAHNAKRWEQELDSLKQKNLRLSQALERLLQRQTMMTTGSNATSSGSATLNNAHDTSRGSPYLPCNNRKQPSSPRTAGGSSDEEVQAINQGKIPATKIHSVLNKTEQPVQNGDLNGGDLDESDQFASSCSEELAYDLHRATIALEDPHGTKDSSLAARKTSEYLVGSSQQQKMQIRKLHNEIHRKLSELTALYGQYTETLNASSLLNE